MEIQPHPYFILFALSAIVCAGIALIVWSKRAAPGAFILFVHLLGLMVWSGANAAMWLSTTANAQEFWLDFSALGVITVTGTFLPFSLTVSLHKPLINRRLFFLLSIEPLIGLLLLWTNDFHHFIHSDPQLWKKDGLAELNWQPGAWFWVDTIYTGLVIAIGIWYLVRSISQNGDLHRRQTGLILTGAFLSLIAGLADLILPIDLLHSPDLSPLVFTLSAIIYLNAMARRKFLDLVPVAHRTLIERMTDGVIVLDAQDRIVEINPAAGQFLNVSPAAVPGCLAKEILSSWESTTHPFLEQSQIRAEVVVTQENQRYIDLNVTPLMDPKGYFSGRILVFRDITARKRNETELHQQILDISNLRDELREQATRDPLTNLFNRRYLEEMLSRELARAERENYPVYVIMLDIDRFKRVNDTCGHKSGDEVLVSLSALIVQHIRRFDAACRYGGEEFVIVMPRLSTETARERAEFVRREFANMLLPCAEMKTSPTLSIGLASYPLDGTNGEQLLDAADQALYAAKSSGRNRIVVYSEIAEKREASKNKTSK